MNRSAVKIFLFVLSIFSMTSCSPLVRQEQPVFSETPIILRADRSIGQTFVALNDGLTGIQVFLSPVTPGPGQVQLHLRSSVDSPADLVTSSLSTQSLSAPGFYRFNFSPQGNSNGQSYYMFLEMAGEGQVQIGTAPADTYLDGVLYQNGAAQDAQMTFRLLYEPFRSAIGILMQVGLWLGLSSVAVLLFALPGWVLLVLVVPGTDVLSGLEKLAIACGLGLSFYPLFLLWTDVIHLQLGPLYAWLPPLGALGILVWRNRSWRPRDLAVVWREWRRSRVFWAEVILMAVVGLIFLARFWTIRSLAFPMWGDSYQHTMMAQLLVDNGGLFNSWEPYAPYGTLTVQFGFPVAVTLLSWITGFPSAPATLFMGQILNALAAFTIYPLAVRLSDGNRWAGVGAVLIAGLVSPMPAFYVNWGRYAQLAGQAILPISLWLIWETLQAQQWAERRILLAGTILAGMLLTYYRMAFYYVTFVVALLIGWGIPHWRFNVRVWFRGLVVLVVIAGIGFALFLPWWLHIANSSLAAEAGTGMAIASPFDEVMADYRVWSDIGFFVPWFLQAISLFGLVMALARKRWMVAATGIWVVALSSLVAGRLIRLPGASMMQSFAVLIALYLPLGLLGGWVIGQLAGWVERSGIMLARIALFFMIMGIALGGAWNQRLVTQPQTFALVTRPDSSAMTWIRNHVPRDARFLVEGFRIYDGNWAVGADAGWWIPLLAGRANTMPPQYAMVNEAPQEPGYSQRVVDLVAHLEKTSPASPEGIHLLCDWGITHVYIGQGQGKTGAGAAQLFSPGQFAASTAFNLLYHQNRVYIFGLDSLECGTAK